MEISPKPGFERDLRSLEQHLPYSTIILHQGLEQEKEIKKFPETHKIFIENFVRQKIDSAPLAKVQTPPLSVPQKQITTQSTVAQIRTALAEVVELAFKHGVDYASQVAKSLGPYFTDLLHDTLVDEFYDELVRRGKLTKPK